MPSSDPAIVRALSVRQPYAEQILLGKKTIEYRSRNSNIRERVYLYASKGAVDDPAEWRKAGAKPGTLPTGVIIGTVEIVGSAYDEDEDIYEWKLARPERLTTPLEPLNQPQPGVWRPQFKATRKTKESSAPPAGAVSDLLYHLDLRLWPAGTIWGRISSDPFSALGGQLLPDAMGSRIWITTTLPDRKTYLAGWFRIDEVMIPPDDPEGAPLMYQGSHGEAATQARDLVEVGSLPWFRPLVRHFHEERPAQRLSDPEIVRNLERAWSGKRASK